MTPYFLALTFMLSSVFFFSSKTEKSRVVTIHRPMVITQERRTPAYYAYQQSQNIVQKKPFEPAKNSVFLSQLMVLSEGAKVQVAEMKFTKREYASLQHNYWAGRTIASELTEDTVNLAYEKVIYSPGVESPLADYLQEDVPELSPSKKWATIKGKFELIEGVGIVDHIIELKRVEEGFVREAGRIDLRAGTYSIDIESPQGVLIARIRDQHGLIVGEDTQRLVNLKSKGGFFEGPFIKVGRPIPLAVNPEQRSQGRNAAASFATASNKAIAASGATGSLFDGQKELSSLEEEFTNVSMFSSSIARVFDPSQTYKNLTTIRLTGDVSKTPMFTKKWVEGAIQYVSDFQKIEFKSKAAPILLGKIVNESGAMSGARVEIEGMPGVSAVYFDQFMIPSQTQSATSSNGYFMFLGLEPGSYRIVAAKGSVILGSQIFVAENDSAGFQHIETTATPSTTFVRSFDAFTSDRTDGEIVSSEIDVSLETQNGMAQFRKFSKSNVSELMVTPADPAYSSLRYVFNGNRDFAHIPLIQSSWIEEIKRIKMINEIPGTGTIIGFTAALNYTAYLTIENFNRNNIIFFNENGILVSSPVEGGGFILFNVPVGGREVVLQENGTDRIFSQVFEIKAQQISAAHFSE